MGGSTKRGLKAGSFKFLDIAKIEITLNYHSLLSAAAEMGAFYFLWTDANQSKH